MYAAANFFGRRGLRPRLPQNGVATRAAPTIRHWSFNQLKICFVAQQKTPADEESTGNLFDNLCGVGVSRRGLLLITVNHTGNYLELTENKKVKAENGF